MHVCDIDGRLYEKRKRERIREFKFAAWCAAFMLTLAGLVIWY